MAHTPGPWTRESGTIIDSRRNIVAVRYSWRHMDIEENRVPVNLAISPTEADANARLIAAAPDLLAALEQMLAAFPAPKIRATNGFDGNLAHAAARAAIANVGKGSDDGE